MTLHFPDISAFQSGISLQGAVAAAIKCTEGTTWLSGDYANAVGRARSVGCWPMSYHFLHAGHAAAQAGWARAHHAGVPLMLDLEPAGSSRPTVADGVGFVDAFRKAGGTCNLVYLPHWYWEQLGRPSLAPFAQRGMGLWSSSYTTYSDTGPGWAPYGGMTPQVWQYTDKHLFHGQPVDFNAYKGTLAQLQALAGGGKPPPGGGDPTIRKGDAGPPVVKAQGRLNAHTARPAVAVDGDFGQATETAARRFQGTHKLAVDGIIGAATWAQLNAAPAARPAPPDTRHHGVWVTAGQGSLADLGKTLGYPPNTLIRMTACHYGTLGNILGIHLGRILNGQTPWNTPVPKGANIWCD
jgi:lysozyme